MHSTILPGLFEVIPNRNICIHNRQQHHHHHQHHTLTLCHCAISCRMLYAVLWHAMQFSFNYVSSCGNLSCDITVWPGMLGESGKSRFISRSKGKEVKQNTKQIQHVVSHALSHVLFLSHYY